MSALAVPRWSSVRCSPRADLAKQPRPCIKTIRRSKRTVFSTCFYILDPGTDSSGSDPVANLEKMRQGCFQSSDTATKECLPVDGTSRAKARCPPPVPCSRPGIAEPVSTSARVSYVSRLLFRRSGHIHTPTTRKAGPLPECRYPV